MNLRKLNKLTTVHLQMASNKMFYKLSYFQVMKHTFIDQIDMKNAIVNIVLLHYSTDN